MKRTLQIILLATMPFWLAPMGTSQQPPQKRSQSFLMPDFQNGKYTFEAARRELISQHNFERITSPPPTEDSSFPRGIISRQDPLPNTLVTPRTVVTLYVSNGPPAPSPTPTPSADIWVSDTLVRKPGYLVGEAVQFRIVVHNAGPSTATNVKVTDTSRNLTNLTFEPSGECVESVCTIKSIDAGASARINVTANIVAEGNFDSTVSVAADQPDLKPGNNTISVSAKAILPSQPNTNSSNNNAPNNGRRPIHDPSPQPFPPPWFWVVLILAVGGGGLVVIGAGLYLIWRWPRPDPVLTDPPIETTVSQPLPDVAPAVPPDVAPDVPPEVPPEPSADVPPEPSADVPPEPPADVPPEPPAPVVNPDVELRYGKAEIDGLQMTGPEIRLSTGLEMGDTNFNGPVPVIKTEVTNE